MSLSNIKKLERADTNEISDAEIKQFEILQSLSKHFGKKKEKDPNDPDHVFDKLKID